jgi:hypothetical protein
MKQSIGAIAAQEIMKGLMDYCGLKNGGRIA